MDKNEIILYETADHAVKLNVNIDGDTVWLSLEQLTDLFDRDKSTISRHIRNVFKEGELELLQNLQQFKPRVSAKSQEILNTTISML